MPRLPHTGTSSTKPSGRGKGASDEALLVKDPQRAVGTTAHRVRERALTSLRHTVSRRRAPCPVEPAEPPIGRPRILVIDDETELREAIAQALTRDGYDVETTLDGREGATLVCRHPDDLIFCDLRMPELDGRGLYMLLCPRVLKRLVFVTA